MTMIVYSFLAANKASLLSLSINISLFSPVAPPPSSIKWAISNAFPRITDAKISFSNCCDSCFLNAERFVPAAFKISGILCLLADFPAVVILSNDSRSDQLILRITASALPANSAVSSTDSVYYRR